MTPETRAALVEALPEGTVVVDADLLVRYSRDVTGRFSGTPSVVVRPRDPEEVATVLRTCHETRTAVVPQGGNTGLVGGAIATREEVVVSLERLDRVGEVDSASRTVVVEAGATLEAVRARAQGHGLELPIDFAARASATIGGMVATDAGGALVVRHGTMRDLVAGLRVVLAGGAIVDHLERPAKDGSGFDVTGLACGSEGTLGIVTAARLKLVPLPAHRTVALVAVGSLDEAAAVTADLRAQVASLEAVVFFLEGGLDLVRDHASLPPPFPRRHGAYLVVSCAGDVDPAGELGAALDRCHEVRDVAVAQTGAQREALWSYRELHNEAINAAGVPHKLDVAVAPRQVPELVARVEGWLSADRAEARGVYYGHLADGNVHVNILGPAPDDDAVDDAVLRIVAGLGGSIGAEHGIGLAKRRWLHLARTQEEIAAMRAVKRALDPNGIMNPGKLLPETPSRSR
ncbi:MAG TPA: FAD-binding oxidoreductase [Actinomycetota bacterium]|nr:FAD-binding oxidoreductase [Actinomycetota bacterium]